MWWREEASTSECFQLVEIVLQSCRGVYRVKSEHGAGAPSVKRKGGEGSEGE